MSHTGGGGGFSVGVDIFLNNRVSSGLLLMAQHFRNAQSHANAFQQSLDRIRLTMVGGALLTGAGLFGLHALQASTKEAEKFQTQLANFRTFGLPEALNRDAERFAKNMNVAGSSYITNMRLINEAQGVFRESGLKGPEALRGAKIAAPLLAKMDFANAGLDPEARGRAHTQNLAMLRFIEMRGGVNDPVKFTQIADAAFKALRSSGGAVNPEQLRQFAARAGIAGQGLSNEALFGKLEPAIVELKGSTAGTALMTAYNRLNGLIKVPNQVKDEFIRTGLWSGVTSNSLGEVKGMRGNPLRDANLFASDPVLWYERNVVPIYQKQGLNAAERARQNALYFGRTGGNLFTLIDRQLPAIHHSVEAQRAALGINASANVAAQTLAGKRLIAAGAWSDLKVAAGEALLPIIATGFQMLVPPLKVLAGLFRDYPGIMKPLVIAFGALSVAAVAAGGILLFSSAIQAIALAGPALAGIGGLIAGVGGVLTGALAPIGAALFGLIAPALPVVAAIVAVGGAIYFIGKALGLDWGALGRKVGNALSDLWYRLTHFGHGRTTTTPAVRGPNGEIIRPAQTRGDSFSRLNAAAVRQNAIINTWLNKNLPSYVSLGGKVDRLATALGGWFGRLGSSAGGAFNQANEAAHRFGDWGNKKLSQAGSAVGGVLLDVGKWVLNVAVAQLKAEWKVGKAIVEFLFKVVDSMASGAGRVAREGFNFNTSILTFTSGFIRNMQRSEAQLRQANIAAGLAPRGSAPPANAQGGLWNFLRRKSSFDPNERGFSAPTQGRMIRVSTELNVDGRRLGQVVSTHQAREAYRPPVGGAAYDPSVGLTPVGAGYMGT